jgi:hypothetical protein
MLEFQCEECGEPIGKPGWCSKCRKIWFGYLKDLELHEKRKEEIRLKKDENL